MARKLELTGKRFGRLRVVGFAGQTKTSQTLWDCVCDCGNKRIVVGAQLKIGNTKSCGCISRDNAGTKNYKHGLSGTRLYGIWRGMLNRCFKESDKSFRHYGGRGISVCDDWLDYVVFHEWALANGYEDTLTIDRADVNGNYCPANCRWVTAREQSYNRRNTKNITYNGETHCRNVWSQITGTPVNTIKYRLNHGYTTKQALFGGAHESKN